MRSVLVGVVVLALSFGVAAIAGAGAPEAAQATSVLTHGEFAQIMLTKLAARQAPKLERAQALERAQKLGLMPEHWSAHTVMTHADLAHVLEVAGVAYSPRNGDAPVTRDQADTAFSQDGDQLRSYVSRTIGRARAIAAPETHTISVSEF
jgi:hypothetical protein